MNTRSGFMASSASGVGPIVAVIPETDWQPVSDYPDTGEAQVAVAQHPGTRFRVIARRTRLVGAQADLFPNWRHHAVMTNRDLPALIADIDHRDHATIELVIRDLKNQALRHFSSGKIAANMAWTVIAALAHNLGLLANPHRTAHHDSTERPHPPPATAVDPRPTDPHRPAMDTPAPGPLVLAARLFHELTAIRALPALT
jgi:hypothetical protein